MRIRNDNNNSGQKSSHQAALAVWLLRTGVLLGRKAHQCKEMRNGESPSEGGDVRMKVFHYISI